MSNKFQVTTETKGVLYFSELPKNTYFLEGSRDINEKGQAFYYTFDNGTCLIPIIGIKTGKVYTDITRAGQLI